MDTLSAAILGIVQGLTEFLPVSSSGHLVLGQHLLGLAEPQLMFDTILHVATLTAVLIFLRREVKGIALALFSTKWLSVQGFKTAWREDENFKLLVLVALGTLPTAVIGLAFKDLFTALFASPKAVGLALLFTGCLLAASKLAPAGRRGFWKIKPGQAVIIGLAQGLAIIPGISRSGTTITTGLFLGIRPDKAARFSFLLSIPAILGALVLQLGDLEAQSSASLLPFLIGFITAAVSGYLALLWLMRTLVRGKFHLFAPYCWLVGLIALLFA